MRSIIIAGVAIAALAVAYFIYKSRQNAASSAANNVTFAGFKVTPNPRPVVVSTSPLVGKVLI